MMNKMKNWVRSTRFTSLNLHFFGNFLRIIIKKTSKINQKNSISDNNYDYNILFSSKWKSFYSHNKRMYRWTERQICTKCSVVRLLPIYMTNSKNEWILWGKLWGVWGGWRGNKIPCTSMDIKRKNCVSSVRLVYK